MTAPPKKAALALVLALGACSSRSTPISYDWDRSPGTLVASYGLAGGNVGSVTRFGESAYGDPLIRLMGDGTLFYGTPRKVKQRKLTGQQIQALLAGMRPELFGDYKENYIYGMATDLPTATLSVNVKVFGKHSVGVYGLEFSQKPGRDEVPEELLAAYTALKARRQGGVDVTPTALYLGAQQIDLTQYPQIDPGAVAAWPLPSVDLASTSIYRQPPNAFKLSDPRQLAALLPLLAPGATPALVDALLFTQGGDTYQVARVVVLP
jgi:hypothetical protein